MAMSLKVIVPPHPLIKHWLSILREKNTPKILYSTGYEQLGNGLHMKHYVIGCHIKKK